MNQELPCVQWSHLLDSNEMSGIGGYGTGPLSAIECDGPNNLRIEEFTHS